MIGLFSLRVRAIFFAMITLAVASAFATLASQLSDFTGGEDGLTFKVPEALQPGTEYLADAVPRRLDRRPPRSPTTCSSSPRSCSCWRCCGSSTRRSAASCRRSARTTSAPRRSATAPSSTARWRASLSALFATLAGVLLALWLRYNGPDTTLSFEIMLDVLLIVVIGGMGTIYGAVVGSVLLVLAQNYLQDLMKLGAAAVQGVPVLAQIVSPDRWLLWLGILFVLSVYYFPSGVVGRLRALGTTPAPKH